MNATVSGCAGPERGRRVLAGSHVVAGDETALPVAIDQQSFMQLEAMVLPDRQVRLHDNSPEFPRSIEITRNSMR